MSDGWTPLVVRACEVDGDGNSDRAWVGLYHGPSGLSADCLTAPKKWLARSYAPLIGARPCEYRLVPVEGTEWLRAFFVRELKRVKW